MNDKRLNLFCFRRQPCILLFYSGCFSSQFLKFGVDKQMICLNDIDFGFLSLFLKPFDFFSFFIDFVSFLDVAVFKLFYFFFDGDYLFINFLILMMFDNHFIFFFKVLDLDLKDVDQFIAVFYFFFNCLFLYLSTDYPCIFLGFKMADKLHCIVVHLFQYRFECVLLFIDVDQIFFLIINVLGYIRYCIDIG